MELNHEQEIKEVERCLNEFNSNLGGLMRKSGALIDPDISRVFATTQIDLTNLALAAHALATKCAVLRHRLYKTAEWNRAYKEAYGVNHPEYVEERNG